MCSSNQRLGRTRRVFDKCCLDARSRPKSEQYISQSKQLDNFFQLLSPLAGQIYRLSRGSFRHIKYATINYASARSQMEKCNFQTGSLISARRFTLETIVAKALHCCFHPIRRVYRCCSADKRLLTVVFLWSPTSLTSDP